MRLSQRHEEILSLFFDGYSVDMISDLLELSSDAIMEELAAAFEIIRVSTLDEAISIMDEYGVGVLSATRH